MVKQTTDVKKNKTSKADRLVKTHDKRVNKIVVQIRRVPSPEKSKDKTNENGEKPKRKYRKRKKQLENGEKLTFSIVDYLKTSVKDKLDIDDIKKQKQEEKKSKKLNGKIGQKSKDTVNDFGNYELLGNDPDDFMIPLDVVISDDPPAPEEEREFTKIEEGPVLMDTSNIDHNIRNYLSEDGDVGINEALEPKIEVLASTNDDYEPNNEPYESNSEILDADSLRSAYKEILNTKDVTPPKDPKGTHFLLTDTSNSKSCEQCGASFTCAYKLKRHMLSHSDERTFFCDLCRKGFKTNYHLSRHKTNVHSIVETFKCDLCDIQFASKVSLKEHKEEQHPSAVVFRCSTCQKTFASRKGQKKHEKLHLQK